MIGTEYPNCYFNSEQFGVYFTCSYSDMDDVYGLFLIKDYSKVENLEIHPIFLKI